MEYITKSITETEDLGRRLAHIISDRTSGSFIAMYGDLGAGKTVFVRGVSAVLSPGSRVKSPTYTLVNEYRKGKRPFFHFDLYRISSVDELEGFGFYDYLKQGDCIAEWSENLGESVPDNSIKVCIEKINDTDRKITIEGLDVEEL